MIVAGLTGGIASGKSYVAALFAEHGAQVLDADRIARQVVEPGGAAYADVVAAFGREILDAAGHIIRPTLRDIIFHDAQKRQALNAIVHPAVVTESLRRIEAARQAGASLVIYEAALLVETGIDVGFAALIVVDAEPEVQIARLMARDRSDREQAEAALASQASRTTRLKAADYVIDNNGDREETKAQVNRIFNALATLSQETDHCA